MIAINIPFAVLTCGLKGALEKHGHETLTVHVLLTGREILFARSRHKGDKTRMPSLARNLVHTESNRVIRREDPVDAARSGRESEIEFASYSDTAY